MEKLLTLSATRLARLIRKKEVTSLEVVRTHIDHIKKVNPLINAVVKDRFRAALSEAEEADRKVREPPEGGLPPMWRSRVSR